MQVATLREHGDLGLGTFESLDGEMVVVDGHFFQVRSDGSVREVPHNVLSPFAAVTAFSPDQSITVENCPDLSYLTSQFDALRQCSKPGDTRFQVWLPLATLEVA